MKEDLFQFIWQHKLFDHSNLVSESGSKITILNHGELNKDSGPDFFNAKIKVDELILAGNIELHIKTSDWIKHKHDSDKAYDNIILHVVYENDVELNSKPETLVLKPQISNSLIESYKKYERFDKELPCVNSLGNINSIKIQSWLERMLTERFEKKSEWLYELHKNKEDFNEVLFIALAKSFGFKTNNIPFELLAKQISLNILLTHKENLFQIEAFLFGIAGFLEEEYNDDYPKRLQNEFEFLKNKYNLKVLNKSIWKFSRMRPSNFPTVRIAQLAALINQIDWLKLSSKELNLNQLINNLREIKISSYWQTHYCFEDDTVKNQKEIGNQSINGIMINAIIPYLFFISKKQQDFSLQTKAVEFLDTLEFEANHKTNKFLSPAVKFESARESQALINLFDNYCKPKKCLNCSICLNLINN